MTAESSFEANKITRVVSLETKITTNVIEGDQEILPSCTTIEGMYG